MTQPSSAINDRAPSHLAARQLHQIQLGVAKESGRSAKLGLGERNRRPFAEGKPRKRSGAIAGHGVEGERGYDYRIREIVDRNVDGWRFLSVESDARGADELLRRAVQCYT